jgi:hypothetical protein
MQALVLAKSRCQSELLQTADRAMAAAREAAALEATYEARKLEVDALQVRRFVRSAARPSHPSTLLILRRFAMALTLTVSPFTSLRVCLRRAT